MEIGKLTSGGKGSKLSFSKCIVDAMQVSENLLPYIWHDWGWVSPILQGEKGSSKQQHS